MTVFISHAPADLEAARDLEKAIERRGQFVELDDGQTAQRPILHSDVLVALISKDFVFSPWRLRHEQRALDAWTGGRLVLVKLDHHFAPVGLRDLPFIDASFEAQRDPFTWNKVADAVREALKPRPEADEQPPEEVLGGEPPPPKPRAARKRGGGLWRALPALLLALPGAFALYAAIAIWLVNRIGPTPGGWPELIAGVNAFGARFGAPEGLTPWLFAVAMALTLVIFAAFVGRLVLGVLRPRRRAPAPASPAPAEPLAETVFVSYARANQAVVLPVIDAVRAMGRRFWVDQQGGVTPGDAWAGEIVRAIKGSGGVLVMCSKAAFESDHVKREVYLADRYGKRLMPIFVEQAEPPEDFEYFFAGVQRLELFTLTETERPAALSAVLGAA